MTDIVMDENHGAVGERLRAPQTRLDLDDFLRAIEFVDITFELEGMASLALDPALSGRIRGAFGEALLPGASPEAAAGRPCPFDPPCAFEVLFRRQGRMTAGTDFPSPWTIGVEPHREHLRVVLTLFGFATEWAPVALEAMTDALLNRLRLAGNLYLPRRVLRRRRLAASAGLPAVPVPDVACLEFASPLVVTGKDVGTDPSPAFTTLGLRIEGLARWHEATLAGEDWGARAAAIRTLSFAWDDGEHVRWMRTSGRQRRAIPMSGTVGRLEVFGSPEAMAEAWPILRIGELIHVGADVAFGCGRYRLV